MRFFFRLRVETLTEATELEEEQQETPTIEVHKDEALTSVSSLLKPHESETTPSSIETQELKETETVVVQSSQPVEKFIADTAIRDDSITVAQDSALPSRVKGKIFGFSRTDCLKKKHNCF